jgi:hypothetical protein
MSSLLRAVRPRSLEEQDLSRPHEVPPGGRLEHFGEPYTRFTPHPPDPDQEPDEALVTDSRADLSPAQMVEQKLQALLGGKGLSISHIRMADLVRHRR